ncbi:hypothetical protein [Pseudomonas sp. TWI628]|uniref:hypothetical protein n=1 Tax=Pseudomonas sp. TWI628 TaxID=3136788 RepID=UPI003207E348
MSSALIHYDAILDSMRKNMERVTENIIRYSEFSHKDYLPALQWLKDLGFNVNNSRYGAIMREIGEFDEGEYSKESVWGLSEMDTLYRVYLGFSDNDSLSNVGLGKLMNGSKYLKDEKIGASENSRNFIFELQMAEVFSRAGAKIGFDTTADFKFELPGGRTGYVECKRVTSTKKLEANLKEAYDQIEVRCGENDVGIVAVDITRLIWQHFEGGLIKSSMDEVKGYLQHASDEVTKSIREEYVYCSTVMVIGVYCVPFICKDNGQLTYYRDMSVSLKYWEKHARSPYNLKFIHRGGLACWMADHLKLSMSSQ